MIIIPSREKEFFSDLGHKVTEGKKMLCSRPGTFSTIVVTSADRKAWNAQYNCPRNTRDKPKTREVRNMESQEEDMP